MLHSQLKEHAYQSGQKAYEQLVEYLSDDEKSELEKQLSQHPYSPEENAAYANMIAEGRYHDLFIEINDNEHPARLLQCLRDGKITTMQYVTSQMFYNVMTHQDNVGKKIAIERILTKDKKIIKLSAVKIEATMKIASSSLQAFIQQAKTKFKPSRFFSGSTTTLPPMHELLAAINTDHLEEAAKQNLADWASEAEKNKFYRLLSEMPASEQFFLLMDDPFFDGQNFAEQQSVIQHINYRLNFNIFSRLRVDKIPKLMIPSAGMMEAYLQATRPETHISPVYRFGLSPIEGLFNTMREDRRDKIICTPILPNSTPKVADNIPANIAYAEAELHDFYHQTLCSNIPYADRQVFIKLIDELDRLATKNPKTKIYVDAIRNLLIDMEFRAYDRHIDKSIFLKELKKYIATDIIYRFWLTLDIVDANGILKLISDMPNLENIDQSTATRLTTSYEEAREIIVPLLAQFILDNDYDFSVNYKFDCTRLMAFESSSGSITHSIKQAVTERISNRIEGKTLNELFEMLHPPTASSQPSKPEHHLISDLRRLLKQAYAPKKPGPLLDKNIRNKMIELIGQDIAHAISVAYSTKSTTILNMVHEILGAHFLQYLNDNVLVRAQEEHPHAFQYVLNEFRSTSYADSLLQKVVTDIDLTTLNQVVDFLYQPKNPNLVYPSDQATLLQRALRNEKVELMFRLTNDGASVAPVPNAVKPGPLAASSLCGRYDLMVLMIYAYHHGAGWVDKFPDVVARIRRMAQCYQPHGFSQAHENESDLEWAQHIIEHAKLPDKLFEGLNVNKIEEETHRVKAGVERFFDRMHSNGHITLDREDPDVRIFLEAKKWSHRGGPMPDIK